MPSTSFQGFLQALDEVTDLGKASHPHFGPKAPESLRVARAIARAQIVLLSSHLERYIYAVNEEVIALLNKEQIHGDKLPEQLRLLHSKLSTDAIGEMKWENWAAKLGSFVADEGWFWTIGASGVLGHDRILAWMKLPKPDSLIRYYRYWGIEDIFKMVTKTQNTRASPPLSIQGLVDLRNNIAHGDFSVQATESDVRLYMSKARLFCERADRALSKRLASLYNFPRPW